jgi:hypothetical protein
MEKIQSLDSGAGMNIPDLIFENLISVFWLQILTFFDADLGSCEPGFRDKHPRSATLVPPLMTFEILDQHLSC